MCLAASHTDNMQTTLTQCWANAACIDTALSRRWTHRLHPELITHLLQDLDKYITMETYLRS